MKSVRIMAVDRAKDSSHFWFVVQSFNPNGKAQMISRGKVKTKGWLTRKARQSRCKEIIATV